VTLQYCGNELTRVGLHDAAISIHMSPYNGTVVMSGMRHNSGACLLVAIKDTHFANPDPMGYNNYPVMPHHSDTPSTKDRIWVR
jgi:fructose-1,6-bisphosphatase/sedoheptulose 1,7-bisphosphatase-like protein